MKTIEIEVIHPDQPNPTEWVPEDALQQTLDAIAAAGLQSRVVGEVSWRRQLAHMENPPL